MDTYIHKITESEAQKNLQVKLYDIKVSMPCIMGVRRIIGPVFYAETVLRYM
jgi:hypothetical protein